MTKIKEISEVEQAERALTSLLNYGGLFVGGSHTNKHIRMAWEQGDWRQEVEQMRNMSSAFDKLASAIEAQKSQEGQ